MSTVQERYTGILITGNGTLNITAEQVGGFLCKTSGTITLTRGSTGQLVVDTYPVTAGFYYPLPFILGGNGGTFTTAGGATGTLGVA